MERQFVESLMRLLRDGKINEKKISDLFYSGKITEQEKLYILNNV